MYIQQHFFKPEIPKYPADVLAPFPVCFAPMGKPAAIIIKIDSKSYTIKWNGLKLTMDVTFPERIKELLGMSPPLPPSWNPPITLGGGDKEPDWPRIIQLPDNDFLIQANPWEEPFKLSSIEDDDVRLPLIMYLIKETLKHQDNQGYGSN